MSRYSSSVLREICDQYVDGRSDYGCPQWVTEFNVGRERVRDAAKLSLNHYNQTEQKNFHLHLEMVSKLNFIGRYFCMTFRAKNAETDECRVFRGVVDGLTRDVLLSEIMEPDDIAILDLIDGDEYYVESLSESKEDHSPDTRK